MIEIMEEQTIMSAENITPLQEVVESLPNDVKVHFEAIKDAIFIAINKE
jgi:hypothetical protein